MSAGEDETPWAWIRAVNDIVTREPFQSETLPVELRPWLYLSDALTILKVKSAHERGLTWVSEITHVVSTNYMLGEKVQLIREVLVNENIRHFYAKGIDEEHYDMLGLHWEECKTFLHEAKESGGKILIHCLGGHNRSVLIAAAAMMVLERTPLLDVVRHIKSKRGIILTNLSFQRQICELAAKEGLLGDLPCDYSTEKVDYNRFSGWGLMKIADEEKALESRL
jgi:protein-tyrosine phosphatase